MNRQQLLALAKDVDWPKVLHFGSVLARVLRGDGSAVQADHEKITDGLRRGLELGQQMVRKSAGCVAPNACECTFCEDEK